MSKIQTRFSDMESSGRRTEWICDHGIGHHRGVHGCDGCCAHAPRQEWEQTTEDTPTPSLHTEECRACPKAPHGGSTCKCQCHKGGDKLSPTLPTKEQKWNDAVKLNMECSHGNLIGWCDDCPKGYFDYVTDRIQSEREAVRESDRKYLIDMIQEKKSRGHEAQTILESIESYLKIGYLLDDATTKE